MATLEKRSGAKRRKKCWRPDKIRPTRKVCRQRHTYAQTATNDGKKMRTRKKKNSFNNKRCYEQDKKKMMNEKRNRSHERSKRENMKCRRQTLFCGNFSLRWTNKRPTTRSQNENCIENIFETSNTTLKIHFLYVKFIRNSKLTQLKAVTVMAFNFDWKWRMLCKWHKQEESENLNEE